MSGTFPSSPKPASVTVSSRSPTLVSTAHSLKRQVRSRGGQRWLLEMAFPPMRRSEAAPLLAFLTAQRGQFESFLLAMPGYSQPQGSWAGAPLVKGAAQSGRAVTLDGFAVGATVKAGDLVQFAGDAKVYMVSADGAADGAGELTLAIEPALLVAPADNAAVTSSNVVMTCALVGDTAEWAISPGLIHSMSVTVTEAV